MLGASRFTRRGGGANARVHTAGVTIRLLSHGEHGDLCRHWRPSSSGGAR